MTIDAALAAGVHVTKLRRSGAIADNSPGAIFQVSSMEALLDGCYEGDLKVGELATHGDFGLGTLQAMDGELLIIDGESWRAAGDGRMSKADPEENTPFAVVIWFNPTAVSSVGPFASFPEMTRLLDQVEADSPCAAFRIEVTHAHLRLSCIRKQHLPYRALVDAAKESDYFDLDDASGTMIGFRFPMELGGIQMPGYHFHFVTADRSRGGHVQDLACSDAIGVAVDSASDLHLEVPFGLPMPGAAISADRLETLRRIENL